MPNSQTHSQNDSDSDEAKDVIKRCLVVDASKRISAAQLMKHPWMMRKNDKKSLWKKKLIRSGRSLTEHLSDYQKRRKALRAKVRICIMRTETRLSGSFVMDSSCKTNRPPTYDDGQLKGAVQVIKIANRSFKSRQDTGKPSLLAAASSAASAAVEAVEGEHEADLNHLRK